MNPERLIENLRGELAAEGAEATALAPTIEGPRQRCDTLQ